MSIKLVRACKLTRFLPSAEAEIVSSIPEELRTRLTGRELALVMEALNAHWHKARAFEHREILGEGCIWDSAAQQLREIEPSRKAA